MYKVAPRPVGTEPNCMERPTQVSFVFRMTGEVPQFLDPVCELALLSVFAGATLLEGSAEFSFVAGQGTGGRGWFVRF